MLGLKPVLKSYASVAATNFKQQQQQQKQEQKQKQQILINERKQQEQEQEQKQQVLINERKQQKQQQQQQVLINERKKWKDPWEYQWKQQVLQQQQKVLQQQQQQVSLQQQLQQQDLQQKQVLQQQQFQQQHQQQQQWQQLIQHQQQQWQQLIQQQSQQLQELHQQMEKIFEQRVFTNLPAVYKISSGQYMYLQSNRVTTNLSTCDKRSLKTSETENIKKPLTVILSEREGEFLFDVVDNYDDYECKVMAVNYEKSPPIDPRYNVLFVLGIDPTTSSISIFDDVSGDFQIPDGFKTKNGEVTNYGWVENDYHERPYVRKRVQQDRVTIYKKQTIFDVVNHSSSTLIDNLLLMYQVVDNCNESKLLEFKLNGEIITEEAFHKLLGVVSV